MNDEFTRHPFICLHHRCRFHFQNSHFRKYCIRLHHQKSYYHSCQMINLEEHILLPVMKTFGVGLLFELSFYVHLVLLVYFAARTSLVLSEFPNQSDVVGSIFSIIGSR